MNQQAYQIEQDQRVLVARPTRVECTGSDIAALIAELRQRIDRGEADSVVIEPSNVQHMDSCCVGKLLALRQHTRSVGGSVALARCQDNVAFLFRMTHLDKLFGLYDTTEQAVAELRERRNRPTPPSDRPASPHAGAARYSPFLAALLRAHRRRSADAQAHHDAGAHPRSTA